MSGNLRHNWALYRIGRNALGDTRGLRLRLHCGVAELRAHHGEAGAQNAESAGIPNAIAPKHAQSNIAKPSGFVIAAYPQAGTIHLAMDDLSSHRRRALVDRYGEKIGGLLWDRFTVRYTPKHGSWLNQAEISLFSRERLRRFSCNYEPFRTEFKAAFS